MEGWNTHALGELATVSAGNPAPQDKALFQDGQHPFVRTSDVGRVRFGTIDSTSDYLNDAGIAKLRRFPRGTILFPKSGASTFLNHRVMMAVDGYVASHLATIQAEKEKVHPWFLLYFLHTVAAQDLVQDHNYPSLNLPLIKSIQIRIPPLPEQERIVAILDEAFAAIATATANAEKNLANARELFDSELNRVFSQKGDGWVETTLGEMSLDFGRGKSKHRPRNADFLYGGNYPFVQTGDIRSSEHIISNYTQTYSEAGLSQSKLWPEGTICITIAANIAETGILGFDACFPDSIIGMVPEPGKSDSGYVEYLLQFFKTELQRQGKGSAQDNINLGTFKRQKFPFAPLPEQQAIVAKLDALSEETKSLEEVQQRKLNALTELKQSILHKAFTGELTADAKVADHSLSEAGV